MFLLIHYVMQDSVEGNLSILWAFITEAYDHFESENRYSQIRTTMFHSKSQPKMKGKAAEIKDFGPVLLAACREFLSRQVILHQKITFVMEGILLLVQDREVFKVF